jgi:hypothetical protein
VDAQIKLSVVASDIFGVSGRAMPAALLAGERDPKRLAQLARTRLRAKLGPLTEAFCGFFTNQHAFLLAKMLARVDALDADLAELDAKLAELIAGFAEAVDRLDEIPGIGQTAVHLLIVELGTDTGQVPDRRAPGVMGPSSPRRQRVRRQTQGQRIDRARQPSHQQRQTAHGQQSHTQGMGRQQPKTRTRRWGRRSTTMRFGSYPAEIGRCDGGRGGSTLQPIRQRPATESLHQVSALAQAPACQ